MQKLAIIVVQLILAFVVFSESKKLLVEPPPVDPFTVSERLIFIGTKWCGFGDIATSYDDLGFFRETDMCCRTHDFCEGYIAPLGSGYGLDNPAFLPKLRCDCDAQFKACLQAVNTPDSNLVGNIYFTAMDKCFKEDFPIIGCQQYGTNTMKRRCIQYELDSSKPRIYQYFDNPFYYY